MSLKKFPVSAAARVVRGRLTSELGLHAFDSTDRTKAHLFAVGGRSGKQFALIVGDQDATTGDWKPQQTRILFESCKLPNIPGISPCEKPYSGSRIKVQSDSNLKVPNQVSCLVESEEALKAILAWYVKGVGQI